MRNVILDIVSVCTLCIFEIFIKNLNDVSAESVTDFSSGDQQIAFVGYVMYRMLGNLLPSSYDNSVK